MPLRTSMWKRVRGVALAAAAFGALTVPQSAANAGFFDFLFAPFQSARPAYPEAPQPGFFPKKAHRPRNLVAKLHPGREGRGAHGERGLIGLMDDDSLKNGDVVMTEAGLRVFTGSSGARHSEDDFARISEIKGLSKAQRSALLFLDSGAAGAPDSTLAAGRSVAEAEPAAGALIVDPKGNRIRYVGP